MELIGSIIFCLMMVIFTVIMIILLRYPLRYLYHLVRTSSLGTGGMYWYEVIYSGNSNSNEIRKGKAQANNMSSLMGGKMNSSALPIYWNRGLTSVIIRKEVDGQAHMYIGIDAKHHDESTINVWANKANCTAEPIDFDDIGFIAKAPMIATRRGFVTTQFDDNPTHDTVGSVMSAIQETIGDGQSGSFLMSFEPMRSGKSELGLVQDHAINTAMKHGGGDAVALSGVPKSLNIFRSGNPSRAVIMGFSDDDDRRVSDSILNNSLNAMVNLGIDVQKNTAMQIHRSSGMHGIAVTLLMAAVSYFGFFSWTLTAVTGVLSLMAMLGIPLLSEKWVELTAKNGDAAIPVFWRYSLRRKLIQFWYDASPFDMDSGNLSSKDYVAEPSCAEVIYLYRTPAMQAISMPMNSTQASNIYTSPIPPVALDRSVNKKLKESYLKSDDVVFVGTSAKSHEMVCRTIDDVNFGMAYVGAPGSGKTNALRNDFYGVSRLSRKETGKAKDYYLNPIWFETKSSDLSKLIDIVKPFKPRVFSLHDASKSYRLSLEGHRYGDVIKDEETGEKRKITVNEVLQNKNNFLAAMKAVLGNVSFGSRSAQIADSALTVAMLMTKEDAYILGIEDKVVTSPINDKEGNVITNSKGEPKEWFRPNIMYLFSILVGADTTLKEPIDKKLQSLLDAKTRELGDKSAKAELLKKEGEEGINRLKSFTGALNGLIKGHQADNGKAVQPLWNKIPKFQESAGLFDTVDTNGVIRKEIDIRKMYSYGGPVIIDMTSKGSNMSESDTRMFTMMVHYMLWQSIQKYCHGWGENYNRYIPLYVDELVNFTGLATDDSIGECAAIVGQVKNQGRSFGASHNVGFQQFEQLPLDARNAALSFESLVIFKLKNNRDREIAISQIGETTLFTSDNLTYLPKGVGIASSMLINGKDVRPFTVRTPFDKEWVGALSRSETVEDAFDMIREDEIKKIRAERKKRVRKKSDNDDNTNVPYHQGYNDDDDIGDDDDDDMDEAGFGYMNQD